ncbi:hypothetical protein GWK15_24875 [Roseomonas oryzicola]|nr:hypothetical protein [Neoroseomonas oryzicola]
MPSAIPTPNKISTVGIGLRSVLASISPPAALTRDFTSAVVLANLAFASPTASEKCWAGALRLLLQQRADGFRQTGNVLPERGQIRRDVFGCAFGTLGHGNLPP